MAWVEAWDAIVPLLQAGAIKPIVAQMVEGRPFGRVVLTI
jgi:hypothetical protein